MTWTEVQGWAGMGGTRLGTTRYCITDCQVVLKAVCLVTWAAHFSAFTVHYSCSYYNFEDNRTVNGFNS